MRWLILTLFMLTADAKILYIIGGPTTASRIKHKVKKCFRGYTIKTYTPHQWKRQRARQLKFNRRDKVIIKTH